MIQTLFDVMDFEPLTWADWKFRYQRHIRVWCEPERMKYEPKVGLMVAMPYHRIYLPWYERGGWQDGKPRFVKPGLSPRMIRIPVVLAGGKILALDGAHRLTQLDPAIVLMDSVEPDKRDLKFFTDMHNPHWRRWVS